MSGWESRSTTFKFQLSDWTLFSIPIRLQTRSVELLGEAAPPMVPTPPDDVLPAGVEGFLIRAAPVADRLPVISRVGTYLRYVPLQYQHCYIDLRSTFEAYQQKFSSKSRSTILRKLRKYAEHCGGVIQWKTYRAPEEMDEFFGHARAVSALSYQEQLLDAGIPGSQVFVAGARQLACENRLRAYVLFDGAKPVSYLYCPADDGVLVYAYLGYDPDYMRFSVGTVLQWLALEQIFAEGGFRAFDFTEGESDHKRLFSTHQRRSANVYLIRRSIVNQAIVRSHHLMNQLSVRSGAALARWGLKARIRRMLRFAR